MPKLIVSLTTIPSRVPYLQATIDSIVAQNLKPDTIELNIPKVYSRRDLGEIDLSGLPTECDVHVVDTDFGPATKILPTVMRYWGSDARLVYCDDDRCYDPDWLSRLVSKSQDHPNSVIAENCLPSAGQEMRARWFKKNNRKFTYRLLRAATLGQWGIGKMSFVDDIVEGFGGVLIRPDFLTGEAYDIPDILWSVDDVWLSGMYQRNGHDVVLTGPKKKSKFTERWIDETLVGDVDPLYLMETQGHGRLAANVACITYMREKYGVFSGDRRVV
ncbi:MAG: hypothetical protein JXQ89_20340 [Pelagimonas sp.]